MSKKFNEMTVEDWESQIITWEKENKRIFLLSYNQLDFLAKKLFEFHNPEPEVIDNYGVLCVSCQKGTYIETSIHDDMDGVLHCSNCGKQVDRRKVAK